MTEDINGKVFHRLWFEALRLSEKYWDVCKWVASSHLPEEKLDWSKYPETKDVYLHMGDVFFVPFGERVIRHTEKGWTEPNKIEEWWKTQKSTNSADKFDKWWTTREPLLKLIAPIAKEIDRRIQVEPIDLCQIVSESLSKLESKFTENFDNAKESLLHLIKERHQTESDLIIRINTRSVGAAKEVRSRVEKLVAEKKEKSRAPKYLMLDDIKKYLDIYMDKNLSAPFGSGLDIPRSTFNRYLKFGRQIVESAVTMEFPKYGY